MNTERTTATIVGVLFIIGTVAGVLSVLLTQPVFSDPNLLGAVAANGTQLSLAALAVLVMGLSLAPIPILVYPIFRRDSEFLALGYVVFRGALESVTYLPTVLSWLLLIGVGQEYARAGAANAEGLRQIAAVLVKTGAASATLTAIVFPLGAVFLYTALYRTRLLPRWLSVWGFIGIALHIVFTGVAGLFWSQTAFGDAQTALNFPIFLQEMVMAVWLIVKGFDSSAIASRSAEPERMSRSEA